MSRIRADRLVNRTALGAPLFPNGVIVSGVTTATTISAAGSVTAATLYGDGAGISGINTNFTAAIGIQSAGTIVGAGITQLNFVGVGITFAVNGSTLDISISGSGGGSGGSGGSDWRHNSLF